MKHCELLRVNDVADDVITATINQPINSTVDGGKFEFDDGGSYRGRWRNGKAHGQGVCSGPGGQGQFSGLWENGFEQLGLYEWPNGDTYLGKWSDGYRHMLGVETREGWIYKGEWNQGVKGKFGVLTNLRNGVRYEGNWKGSSKNGLGTETYSDGGTYQGEWCLGKRHGVGIRQSCSYGSAASRKSNSLSVDRSDLDLQSETSRVSTQRIRNGFVLLNPCLSSSSVSTESSKSSKKKNIFSRMKSKSNLGAAYSLLSIKSSRSSSYKPSKSKKKKNLFNSFDVGCSIDEDVSEIGDDVTETYYGEWVNNTRQGHGVCQRSDGVSYEGQWFNDQRHGYGVTSYDGGKVLEGQYRENVFVGLKKQSLLSKSNKDKVLLAVVASHKAKRAAMKVAEVVATNVYQSRNAAAKADQVAKDAKKQSQTAQIVAELVDKRTTKQTKLNSIGNYPNSKPSHHKLVSEPEVICMKTTTQKSHPNKIENQDEDIFSKIFDETSFKPTTPTKSKNEEKLRSKRNYLRPYKMAKHINEARKEERFDWRKADAKSRRRKWADAVSQKKLTLPAEIPPVTSHRPHQYKERTTKSTAPPSEVLQIDALKPRNSRILQTRIYHHTFDQLDSLQLNEEDSLFRDYSELENIKDTVSPQKILESKQVDQLNTWIPFPGRNVPKEQIKNVYQMLLVFVINVGFVFMFLRIPYT